MRWDKYSPSEFIEIAEKSGLIIELGYVVIDLSFQQAALWKKNISVNLSIKQLNDSNLINYIQNSLKKYNCEPEYISFEITETYIMEDAAHAIIQLQRIKDLGINLYLDDFGTGYSSLSYLKKMPISKIKIDKSFIDNLIEDPDDLTIVNTIIHLAKNLKLSCIAEGVETIEQSNKLLELGCHEIQGYFYGKPKLAKDIIND